MMADRSELVLREYQNIWEAFLEELEDVSDPFLKSIFDRSELMSANSGRLIIRPPATSSFFIGKLEDARSIWFPRLKRQFPYLMDICIFDGRRIKKVFIDPEREM